MFGLGWKNNIIIRKKECTSNKNWNKPNPNADGIRRRTRENRNDYCISDLKFECNKRFYLPHPALLCFRLPNSNSV